MLIRQANLSQDQARLLEQIALECEQEIQLVALRAKPLIEAYRAQYPGGEVPQGHSPAPLPVELRQMSEERNAIILLARNRLHTAFGDDEFNRFDNFVKTRVASNIQKLSPQ